MRRFGFCVAFTLVAFLDQRAVAVPGFGPVTPVRELNSGQSDELGSLTGDGLTIVIESRRNGVDDRLWTATRPNLTSPFGPLSDASFLSIRPNPSEEAGSPVISADGLTLFFAHSTPTNPYSIFVATRANTTDQFGMGTAIPNIGNWAHSRPSWLSPDGLRLYFHAGDAGSRLYVAERATAASPFGTPTNAPFANFGTSSVDSGAALTPDELQVFFASDRAGGLGNMDIWWASRPDRSTPFGAPANLTSINSDKWDTLPVLFGDTLFFTSERNGPSGYNSRDIFAAQLVPEPGSLSLFLVGGAGLLARRRGSSPARH